jgi:hypothetical protein
MKPIMVPQLQQSTLCTIAQYDDLKITINRRAGARTG